MAEIDWGAALGIGPGDPRYPLLVGMQQAMSSTQGEDTRRWDLTYQANRQEAADRLKYQMAQVNAQYKVGMANAKNDAERNQITKWYNEQQVRLADQTFGLEQAKTGLDLLKTDVQLRSTPLSWAQLADWESGVRANPNAPVFLQRLLENTNPGSVPTSQNRASIGLPGQNSAAQTMANLSPGGGGSSGGSGASQDADPRVVGIQAIAKQFNPSGTDGWDAKDVAMLNAIAALAQQGEAKYANNFAQLNKDQKDEILGGFARLGLSPSNMEQRLEQARIGNTVGGLAA